MHIEYKIEPRDYQDYSVACSRKLAGVNGTGRQIAMGVVLWFAIAVIGMIAALITGNSQIAPAVFAGAWLFWLINYLITLYTLRRLASVAFPEEGAILGKRRMSIVDDGLEIKSELHDFAIKFKAIHLITVQHLVLVLWTEPAHGIFVPRAAFATADDEKRFTSIVNSRISGANA
jgi:hypothetical protein